MWSRLFPLYRDSLSFFLSLSLSIYIYIQYIYTSIYKFIYSVYISVWSYRFSGNTDWVINCPGPVLTLRVSTLFCTSILSICFASLNCSDPILLSLQSVTTVKFHVRVWWVASSQRRLVSPPASLIPRAAVSATTCCKNKLKIAKRDCCNHVIHVMLMLSLQLILLCCVRGSYTKFQD